MKQVILTDKELNALIHCVQDVLESGGSVELSKTVLPHRSLHNQPKEFRKASPQCKLLRKLLKKVAPLSEAKCPDCR